jgi:hypothetical protein
LGLWRNLETRDEDAKIWERCLHSSDYRPKDNLRQLPTAAGRAAAGKLVLGDLAEGSGALQANPPGEWRYPNQILGRNQSRDQMKELIRLGVLRFSKDSLVAGAEGPLRPS